MTVDTFLLHQNEATHETPVENIATGGTGAALQTIRISGSESRYRVRARNHAPATNGYRTRAAYGFDMFFHTAHLEILTSWTRMNAPGPTQQF